MSRAPNDPLFFLWNLKRCRFQYPRVIVLLLQYTTFIEWGL